MFLLFNIGLELSLDRLQSMAKYVFGMGSVQVRLGEVMDGKCYSLVSVIGGLGMGSVQVRILDLYIYVHLCVPSVYTHVSGW